MPADRLAETTDTPPGSGQERALRVAYTFPNDPDQHRVRPARQRRGQPPTMPVADPLSHVWASSDERLATIHAVTGSVTAISAGSTTISVTTGGITSRLELTVTPR